MNTLIARSASKDFPCQTYASHVSGVREIAVGLAKRISKKIPSNLRKNFIEVVEYASEFHDFGKIDKSNQDALFANNLKRLPY
ncbi:MAG: hypothetical protein M0R48_11375, partial [Candidatus Omnitrophica bacterium]|nr:hypothetical protein [Candidatus Omnitrophota bacterium]